MARKAGSIVLDRLRDRILVGHYFGCWAPGDRLPSVRDVARAEGVDRKTAAAAYRRLEKEGLVHVEPRSGVYLEADGGSAPRDPLRRLHLQWLEHTLESAARLGLDSAGIQRVMQAVASVEAHRVPVADDDSSHAALLASELCERTGLDCRGCRPDSVPAASGPLKDAAFVVASPAVAVRFRRYGARLPVVRATLEPALFGALGDLARKGRVLVLVATSGLARDLEAALDHGLVPRADRIGVGQPRSAAEVRPLVESSDSVVVWPGAPGWLRDAAPGAASTNGHALLAETTVAAVRRRIAGAALALISTSNGAGSRQRAAG